MHQTANNEKALLQQIARGDETAFRKFFLRYNTKVYYFIHHIVPTSAEAEELVQDVFLKLWLNREKLADVDQPDNYLFITSRNRALDHLAKAATEKKRQSSVLYTQEDASAEEQLFFKESQAIIHKAVQTLPEQQQMVYRLSKEEGLSREEVAERMQLSPNTVRNHLAAAIRSIRLYLDSQGHLVVLSIFLYYMR